MKKRIALVLMASLMLTMTACGSKADETVVEPTVTEESESVTEEETESVSEEESETEPEETAEPEPTPEASESEKTTPEETESVEAEPEETEAEEGRIISFEADDMQDGAYETYGVNLDEITFVELAYYGPEYTTNAVQLTYENGDWIPHLVSYEEFLSVIDQLMTYGYTEIDLNTNLCDTWENFDRFVADMEKYPEITVPESFTLKNAGQ